VEVLNALLLPLVLVFLVALALRVLPRPYALSGRRLVALVAVIGGVVAVGLLWVGLTLGA
jgi:hypothetical protein